MKIQKEIEIPLDKKMYTNQTGSSSRQLQIQSLLSSNANIKQRDAHRFELGLRLISGKVLTLRIELPSQFPHIGPLIKILDQNLQHNLLDSFGNIKNHQDLLLWRPSSNLGAVVSRIVNELCNNPPKVLSNQPPPPSYPGIRQQRELRESQKHNHDERVALPAVPSSFDELNSKNMSELQHLLDSDEALEEFFQQLELVKNVKQLKESMKNNNINTSKSNLKFEEEINMAKAELDSVRSALKTECDEFNQVLATQAKVLQKFNPLKLALQLESLAQSDDDRAEDLAQDFLNGDLEYANFHDQYLSIRNLYHMRHSKSEKLKSLPQ